ncbi:phosphohistidine phosphatase SixA [Inmirania thermothiophila]|uniref:Phosphohistidine phosphatase SixA n=1 Tax=Inmirania thermothiophila TaxID=1750597 RepID=A0A3N1Y135_9GAMM|nr:phosphohistidine phosphatase SixA [Inmirania thermothiophila]ROR32543.1 phosphohistidine phosphatase SixA [Inmirania thermothiophila]
MLYLVQHGRAKSEAEDPQRPLTEAGAAEVRRVAEAAARIGVRPRRILHSGRLRAAETAAILAEALAPPEGTAEQRHLGPQADPARIAAELHDERDVMIVGHLPHLERLAAYLVTGAPEPAVIRFRNGGIVALARTEEEDRRVIVWTLYPGLCA